MVYKVNVQNGMDSSSLKKHSDFLNEKNIRWL
jgi:hypothetical protein